MTKSEAKLLNDMLFEMRTPALEMVIEDASTSDDPLENHLQRKGWRLKHVAELQDSISEKLTVDMFTGRTVKLFALEFQLQSDIQEFLNRIRCNVKDYKI